MRRKPWLLKLIMVGSAIGGVVGVVATVGFLATLGLVPGPYMVNRRAATFDEFMGFALPLLGSYFLMSVASLAVAWGLKRERMWARPLFMGVMTATTVIPFLFAFLSGAYMGPGLTPLFLAVGFLALVWWRMYFDDDVVAYYAALRDDAFAK